MPQFTFCQSTVKINFVVSAISNKLSVNKIKGCPWLTCGLIILEMKGDNEPAIISLPKKGKKVSFRGESNPGPSTCEVNTLLMNDFPVIGDPCFAHRVLGSPGGKHCESLQGNVWRGVVSPLKAVSLDIECHILP